MIGFQTFDISLNKTHHCIPANVYFVNIGGHKNNEILLQTFQ